MRLLAGAASKRVGYGADWSRHGAGVRLARRRVLAGLGASALPEWPVRAFAAEGSDVSDWVASDHARVRLIDAGREGPMRLAGLQIQLDPSYLTYWRTPGEAGVAPTVDFAGSRNLASATLLLPSPQRFDEAGAEAFGYKDEVVFPILVTPVELEKPISLSVALSFAVCSDLCLPGSAVVRLDLAAEGGSPEAGLVRDARRRVPVPQPLAGAGVISIESVEPGSATTAARVLVRTPVGETPLLIVEAPEPWYMQVTGAKTEGKGLFAFDLRVLSGPAAPARIPVTLTVATDTAAIESKVQLDVRPPTP